MSDLTNLVAVAFDDDSKAYQAYSELRQAEDRGRIGVQSAALVRRAEDGTLQVPEGESWEGGGHAIGGSLVGFLIGAIGGPVGILLGWSTGALVGGAHDARKADQKDVVLMQVSEAIPVGSTTLVAEVDEPAVEVLDTMMATLGGVVLRRSAVEVLAEIEAAEDAAEAAEKEAKKAMREQKRADRKEKYEDRKAELHNKLHKKTDVVAQPAGD